MARQIRSDSSVGTAEKRLGVEIRNENGRKVRSDCKIGTLRKRKAKAEAAKKSK